MPDTSALIGEIDKAIRAVTNANKQNEDAIALASDSPDILSLLQEADQRIDRATNRLERARARAKILQLQEQVTILNAEIAALTAIINT